jgi:hypothetical protein
MSAMDFVDFLFAVVPSIVRRRRQRREDDLEQAEQDRLR